MQELAQPTGFVRGFVRLAALLRSAPARLLEFRWLVACGAFLVSPAFLYELGLFGAGDGGIDKIALFALPASVLWATLALTALRRVRVTQLLLLPIYAIVAGDLFLVIMYDTRLTSSVISIILENAHHAADFVDTQHAKIAASVALFLLFYGILYYKTRGLVVRSGLPVALALIGLTLLYGAVIASRVHAYKNDFRVGFEDVVSHDRNSPFGFVPQGYIAHQIYADALEHGSHVKAFRFGATRDAQAGREVYVLVIGESSRPDRWSLYGHSRPTTPRLAQEPGLILLRNMVTQVALTQASVPLMLTRDSIENLSGQFNEKSIVSAYSEAGFETFWLSTQQRDQYTGAINRYSNEADTVVIQERRVDGVLVDEIKRLLAERAAKDSEKLFFVIHTQGSHFVFRDRYPATLAAFEATGTPQQRSIIEYDNTIEYTDRVLADLLGALKGSGGLSALLYMSDHGTNLWDDSRGLFGHFFNNEYDMPAAGFLWTSDAFAQRFPEKIRAARANANLPLNTRIGFSTLADMGGLHIPGTDLSKLSILSDAFTAYPRMFVKAEKLQDYDLWLSEKAPSRGANPAPR